MVRVSHAIEMMCHHNERHRAGAHTVAVHLTNHTRMHRHSFKDENVNDLSGMSGTCHHLICPGATGILLKSILFLKFFDHATFNKGSKNNFKNSIKIPRKL